MENNFTSLYEHKKNKSDVAFSVTTVLLVVFLFVLIILNTFVFFTVCVSGESMEKTLSTGDCLIANRYKDADYGEVVIVNHDGKLVVKRIIALGGDSVKIEDGKVFLKKRGQTQYEALSEPYINGNFTTVKMGEQFEWVLKNDEIFYLGDNRVGEKSYDCRAYGPIKQTNVVGVVETWSIKIKGFLTKLNDLVYN